jgi:hypothetical protein
VGRPNLSLAFNLRFLADALGASGALLRLVPLVRLYSQGRAERAGLCVPGRASYGLSGFPGASHGPHGARSADFQTQFLSAAQPGAIGGQVA